MSWAAVFRCLLACCCFLYLLPHSCGALKCHEGTIDFDKYVRTQVLSTYISMLKRFYGVGARVLQVLTLGTYVCSSVLQRGATQIVTRRCTPKKDSKVGIRSKTLQGTVPIWRFFESSSRARVQEYVLLRSPSLHGYGRPKSPKRHLLLRRRQSNV